MEKSQSYDARLKEACREIETICKRFDVGAHILLVSETHAEFRIELPSWSALTTEVDETGAERIRLRVNKAEMGLKLAHEKAELTAHFLYQLRDESARLFQFAETFIAATKDKWKTEHTITNCRPHRRDEN